ncbi:MAG: hybrid sensor histidine kinase/response regulator [Chloroflexota bacterium]|nr:MAG: hybrid sensor histidine kinase/response regulator [Chloroflexota bacterium]
MDDALQVLILEDRPADAELMVHELRREGFEPTWQRVEAEDTFRHALMLPPDLILADYSLPDFDALRALRALKVRDLDIPFIVVTGSIHEDEAVECIRAGAHDYVIKDRLGRLGPAVRRAFDDARGRRERRRSEVAARATEERYRAVVEQSMDAIMIARGTEVVFANQARADLIGVGDIDAVRGLTLQDFIVVEDWPLVRDRTLARQRGEHPPSRYQCRFRRATGEVRTVEVVASTVTLDGEPVALAVLRDVTERVSKEENRARLATIVEASEDAIVGVTAVDWSITSWNRGAEQLYGYSSTEAIGRELAILFPPEQVHELHDARERVSRGEHVQRPEAVRMHKDGGRIDVAVSISPIKDEAGRVVGSASIARDIGERTRARQALELSNRRLTEALAELRQTQQHLVQQERLRAMGEMASGIAHDFNNQLGLILGYSELLLDRSEEWGDRESVERSLNTIYTAASDAAVVVRSLRAFYGAPGEIDAHTEPIDLQELVAQVAVLTRPRWRDQALARGATIDLVIGAGKVPPILGIEAELREVLTNLIFNAVDAMPDGGVIDIRARSDDDHVVLTVGDHGIGMSEEVRRRCFEPFFSTKGEHGSGLGLSMVHGLVRRIGGTIDVASAPDRGTTFTIRLPLAVAGAALIQPAAVRPRGCARILLVDDEPGLRRLGARLLSQAEHTVVSASNGREALELFRAGSFDLVITDRAMPEMDGDQVALAIKAISPSTPVVLLTGFGSLMNASEEMPLGVDAVLSKPISGPELTRAIDRLLADQPVAPSPDAVTIADGLLASDF